MLSGERVTEGAVPHQQDQQRSRATLFEKNLSGSRSRQSGCNLAGRQTRGVVRVRRVVLEHNRRQSHCGGHSKRNPVDKAASGNPKGAIGVQRKRVREPRTPSD
jgi:hypothetical protein